VSRIALGTGPLGMASVPESDAAEAVAAALEGGIRHIDTAPSYGVAERRVGAALAGVPRSDFTITTKVGRLSMANDRPYEPGSVARGEARFDFTAAGVRRSLERSLALLGTDHVDAVLLHDPENDLAACFGQALPELARARSEGLTPAIGIGTTSVETALRLVDEAELDVVMLAGRWTLANRSGLPVLEACARGAVRVHAAAPFQSGLLAAPGALFDYRPPSPADAERVESLAACCHRFGVDLPTAALQFPLRHESVEYVVAGMRSRAEVEENLRRAGTATPDALWDELSAAGG
jgi:D-threo-aldose 1-dehydrogenase